MAVKPIPDGYHNVTPYLVVRGIARLIDFLKEAFGAVELERMTLPNGSVTHAEVQIGDSKVMLGEAGSEHKPICACLLLYVTDVDSVYRQAVQSGGRSLSAPQDMFYGDRSGGVEDPCGNQWWISTHKEDVPHDELIRRAQAARHPSAGDR